MAYDNRHTLNMRVSEDIWEKLQAIKDENHLETDVQTVRFLIRSYQTKENR